MKIRLVRVMAFLAGTAALTALVPLGCRTVLGIEPLGSDTLTCDLYCDTIASACTGATLQYASRDACMGLCATFPVGTLQDNGVDTLGCRLSLAMAISNTGEGSCAGAGPGGAGDCGTDYASFCASAVQVCPTDFKDVTDCAALTAPSIVPECGTYSVTLGGTLPDVNSIQCRLYHLTAATLDPVTHCPHVLGLGLCRVDGPQCDGSDGGTTDGGDGG
jgi:hypothetical protein